MKTTLSINIKRLRKERKLTQEQLAQAMNVTIGAVYKWEQDLSTPDLTTIMDLAHFFCLSVDALIGYDAMNQNLDKEINVMKQYVNDNRYDDALNIADKLLVLYPNNFDVLFNCGLLYEYYVFEKNDKDKISFIDKALNLLYKAKDFVNETKNPSLNSYYIDSHISECYNEIENYEKAIEILKSINYEGVNNSRIAEIIIQSGDKNSENLKKCLGDSFLYASNSLINSLLLMVYYCDINKDSVHLNEVLNFSIDFINLMRPKNNCGYMNKSLGYLYFRKALLLNENHLDYDDCLKNAYNSIIEYDSAEKYTNNDVVLSFLNIETKRMIDDGGLSSISLINDYIKENKIDQKFLNKWYEIIKEMHNNK